ncbi:MAG: hypothetical protein AAGI66_00785 [Cyanobacteria bacterium P01_H01_bin.74]
MSHAASAFISQMLVGQISELEYQVQNLQWGKAQLSSLASRLASSAEKLSSNPQASAAIQARIKALQVRELWFDQEIKRLEDQLSIAKERQQTSQKFQKDSLDTFKLMG